MAINEQTTKYLDEQGLKLLVEILKTKFGNYTPTADFMANGQIKTSLLPSYVDDVLEYTSKTNFPPTGEAGKIYVAKDNNKTYRWGGTSYVEISASLAIGTTAGTAFGGDRGLAVENKANANATAINDVNKKVTNLENTITTDFVGSEDNYVVINPSSGTYNYGFTLNPAKVQKSTQYPEDDELITYGRVKEYVETNVKALTVSELNSILV